MERFTKFRRSVVLVIFAGACLIVATQVVHAGAGGETTSGNRSSTVTTPYGVSASLPERWQMADERLVPKLVSPRDVAAFGTFEMPAGGGGNCGMYPVEALAEMDRDDVLIHLMETHIAPGASWIEEAKARPASFDLALKGGSFAGIPGRWTNTFQFRVGRRHFYLFVAFGSRPGRAAIAEAKGILDSVEFSRPVSWPSRLS